MPHLQGGASASLGPIELPKAESKLVSTASSPARIRIHSRRAGPAGRQPGQGKTRHDAFRAYRPLSLQHGTSQPLRATPPGSSRAACAAGSRASSSATWSCAPGLPQRAQQAGDAARVVEGGVRGRVTGQQLGNLVLRTRPPAARPAGGRRRPGRPHGRRPGRIWREVENDLAMLPAGRPEDGLVYTSGRPADQSKDSPKTVHASLSGIVRRYPLPLERRLGAHERRCPRTYGRERRRAAPQSEGITRGQCRNASPPRRRPAAGALLTLVNGVLVSRFGDA